MSLRLFSTSFTSSTGNSVVYFLSFIIIYRYAVIYDVNVHISHRWNLIFVAYSGWCLHLWSIMVASQISLTFKIMSTVTCTSLVRIASKVSDLLEANCLININSRISKSYPGIGMNEKYLKFSLIPSKNSIKGRQTWS